MSVVSQLCSFSANNLQLRARVTSNRLLPFRVVCTKTSKVAAKLSSDEVIVRRSGGYRPSKWDYQFIESLTSEYVGESYTTRIEELKGEVKTKLERAKNPLEMIDTLQRLGVAYHFEDEIEKALNIIYINHKNNCGIKDLYTTALEFRLLRQQGYNVNEEVFDSYMDEHGKFKACLCDDIKGLVYLYEASYLSIQTDKYILDEARDFTRQNLKQHLNKIKINECSDHYQHLASHAVELPLHWRMQRSEAWWFIQVYEKAPHFDPIILQLAKLDFNMVQVVHQEDLKHVMRWWKKMGLGEKLKFARARPIECLLWTLGVLSEPQFGYFRRMVTRGGALLTVIDDIYDVYGTLDELRLFTDAVVRWDINAMEQLPEYMKICFLALFNSINEMAFDLLKDQGLDIVSYLKKGWADICKAYLVEAEWYHSGYKPSPEEYLQNAWITIGIPVLLVYAYFTAPNQITDEASQCLELEQYPDIVRFSAMVTRLADDLETSSHEMKRGDTPKAIQCYAHENGVSEAEAREHVNGLIGEEWKKINGYVIENKIFSTTYIKMAMNVARTSLCMYQFGDGFGAQNPETQNHIISLIIQPLPLS